MAAPEWIAELDKVRQPYNLNALTQAAAPVLLAEQALLAEQVARRSWPSARGSRRALARLPGVACLPDAHELRAGARSRRAALVRAAARTRGSWSKNLHGGHPLLAHCLRITVGTPAENDALLAALETIA